MYPPANPIIRTVGTLITAKFMLEEGLPPPDLPDGLVDWAASEALESGDGLAGWAGWGASEALGLGDGLAGWGASEALGSGEGLAGWDGSGEGWLVPGKLVGGDPEEGVATGAVVGTDVPGKGWGTTGEYVSLQKRRSSDST